MPKEIWINLPVKDIERSKRFFSHLDFRFNPQHGNSDHSACLWIGDHNVVVMLFTESVFKSFTGKEVPDSKTAAEVLLSIDAGSPEEVDELARKAEEAGGTVVSKPSSQQGWMYGCVFADPDGHQWNVLHMDMSKMPK